MKKDLSHRIAYYLRKVAEKGSVHPARKQPAAYKYRNERLMLYKKLMHRKIKAAGY
ncbi:hypothetical protein ACOSZF_21745 [Cytobacillus firmus]|uniref:hypothetical protein n=1 Tax=Cytobacillus firmus TaxID=1399 RepID=UPI0018CCC6A4|nr:hypothetical protein [Cytobacillus firmus]MED1907827.1 hypothetical protein [Cytobacillus firmus]